jgi:hypothetical protein
MATAATAGSAKVQAGRFTSSLVIL